MDVGKVCTREVETIRKSDSVLEAARRMRERHVGDLVVLDGTGGGPAGVLTDRDIVIGVLAQDVTHISRLSVGDVVTAEVVVAKETDEVADVLERMQKEGVRRVPVVDDKGLLVGIFALDDAVRLLGSELSSVASLITGQREREKARRGA